MKIKRFDEFINENYTSNISVYQNILRKALKEINTNLYYAATFGTSLTVLIPIVEKFAKTNTFEFEPSLQNISLLTIYAFSILTKESKDKILIIYKLLKSKNIEDTDIKKVVNVLRNIKNLFCIISENSGKVVENFLDMITYTGMFLPFINVITSLTTQGYISANDFTVNFRMLVISLGTLGLKLLLNRILKKLNAAINSTNKFQNKDNMKPLIVDDEFKSPLYKRNNDFISEPIGEDEVEYELLDDEVLKESKNTIGEEPKNIFDQVKHSRKLSKDIKELILPLFIQSDIGGTRYNKGRVFDLKIPNIVGKSFDGVSLGADKNGFFVFTHRARSKSYTEIEKIPNKDIKFIETTG